MQEAVSLYEARLVILFPMQVLEPDEDVIKQVVRDSSQSKASL